MRRHTLLHVQHHDRPSLLAGKLHAVLQRRWPDAAFLEPGPAADLFGRETLLALLGSSRGGGQ